MPARAIIESLVNGDHLKWPAVRYVDKDGETWTYSAPRHSEAETKLVDALGYTPHYNEQEDGFVTYDGTFLCREAAYKRAIQTGQYADKPGGSKDSLIAELVQGMAPRDMDEYEAMLLRRQAMR